MKMSKTDTKAIGATRKYILGLLKSKKDTKTKWKEEAKRMFNGMYPEYKHNDISLAIIGYWIQSGNYPRSLVFEEDLFNQVLRMRELHETGNSDRPVGTQILKKKLKVNLIKKSS